MNQNLCPNCSAPIPENAPGGFCPACLLKDAGDLEPAKNGLPSLEEIALAFPNLEVRRLIGQGGMGLVYEVYQPALERTVALKILSPALSNDPAFAERFAREARTLGKLNHPNIVGIHEHGEQDGFYYLMMEFVDGVNLRQALKARRMSPEQALAIIPGICDALQTAHLQGIWHRDIKPENILLDQRGQVKIADFGIARIVGDPARDFTLTKTGGALGSAAYMAPEQHENPHEVDHRADIYSLGVVIYEMLTGGLPMGRFAPPSEKSAVDARVDEIVFRALEKEREMRQQSADVVKTDFQNMKAQSAPAERKRPGPPLEMIALAFLISAVFAFPILSNITGGLEIFSICGLLLICALTMGILSWKEMAGKFVVISICLLLMVLMGVLVFKKNAPIKEGATRKIRYTPPAEKLVTKAKAPPHASPKKIVRQTWRVRGSKEHWNLSNDQMTGGKVRVKSFELRGQISTGSAKGEKHTARFLKVGRHPIVTIIGRGNISFSKSSSIGSPLEGEDHFHDAQVSYRINSGNSITISQRLYSLTSGRVFHIRNDGSLRQLPLFPDRLLRGEELGEYIAAFPAGQ